MLNGKVYDVIKWTNAILFPGTAVLISSLGEVWSWDIWLTASVVATVNIVNAFLGLLIGVSYVQYNKRKETK